MTRTDLAGVRSSSRGSVLISGAGIAGPALAFWLSRYGFAVTVVETKPEALDRGRAAMEKILGRMHEDEATAEERRAARGTDDVATIRPQPLHTWLFSDERITITFHARSAPSAWSAVSARYSSPA